MSEKTELTCKHFLSYSGIKLPLKLINPLEAGQEQNRNTYYRGYFDEQMSLLRCEKVVYGEVEMEHLYSYYADGTLKRAEITMDDETDVIDFNAQGAPA